MRYVLGPASDFAALNPPSSGSTPPTLADLIPTIVSRDETGVTLAFAPFDAASSVAPVEARAFWLAEGQPAPPTASDWMASGLPNAAVSVQVTPDGLQGVFLATPPAAFPAAGQPAVNCMIQTVLGFND